MEKGPLLPAEYAPLVNGRIWMVICGQLAAHLGEAGTHDVGSPDDLVQRCPPRMITASSGRCSTRTTCWRVSIASMPRPACWVQGRVSGGDHTPRTLDLQQVGTCCGW